MNIMMVMGVYAALSKAQGIPLRFPGSGTTYDQVFAQITDAHWLARASLWATAAPSVQGQAFNLVGEPFRWEHIWHLVASELEMDVAPPQPLSLSRHMPAQVDAWNTLAAHHRLHAPPFESIVSWGFGDFIFNTEFDVISDMGKIRRAGFVEPADNTQWIKTAIAELKQKKILP